VVCQVPISFIQATLGTEIEVPDATGKKTLRYQRIEYGEILKIKAEGFPNVKGYGRGINLSRSWLRHQKILHGGRKELLAEFEQLSRGREK